MYENWDTLLNIALFFLYYDISQIKCEVFRFSLV